MSPYVQTDVPEGQTLSGYRFRNGPRHKRRVRAGIRRTSSALAIVALIGGASAIAAQADTDGQPTFMVRIPPLGSVHVGAVRKLSGRIGNHVLVTRGCDELATGDSWCLDWKRAHRTAVVYERVNQDLINDTRSWARVFVWAR